MATLDDLKLLFAEFPREAISWRAQSMTRDGDKAMALAYIDARDVMDRLDQFIGPADWSDRYEFHGSRTVCYLSIRVEGEWITKADGAGDSDVEAEKGAISDALKRAAVKWGIGRYLYSLPVPWVPCESYEKGGKRYWKRWTADPWSCVRGYKPEPVPHDPVTGEVTAPPAKRQVGWSKDGTTRTANSLRKEGWWEQFEGDLKACDTIADLTKVALHWSGHAEKEKWPSEWKSLAKDEINAYREALLQVQRIQA